MNDVVNWAIGFLIIMPLLTLLHELGHAVPQLINNNHVTIQIGGVKNSKTFKLGRLNISIAPFSYFGYCSINSKNNHKTRILSLLTGPLVSLTLAILFYILNYQDYGYWINFHIKFSLYTSISQTIFTLLPIKYPAFMRLKSVGHKSDGLQVLELLKRAN